MAEHAEDRLAPKGTTEAADTGQWFEKSFTIPDPAQALLERYSGFAPDEIVPHVTDLVSGIRLDIRTKN